MCFLVSSFKGPEITIGVVLNRTMEDDDIGIIHDGICSYCLVDGINPGEGSYSLIEFGAELLGCVQNSGDGSFFIVDHLHNLDLWQEHGFQCFEFLNIG